MRSIIALLVFSIVPLAMAGCGPSKPDPREAEDFIDTSDPGSSSLYSPEDFQQGQTPRR